MTDAGVSRMPADRPPDGDETLAEDRVIEADREDLAPFVHPAEADFASFLDFYRIRWQYEPRSFPLRWRDGRIAEMFTPDFYLPERDLFVELTTMKQSLVTKKNRKVKRLRELYPEIKIRLLYQKDFEDLIFKYTGARES